MSQSSNHAAAGALLAAVACFAQGAWAQPLSAHSGYVQTNLVADQPGRAKNVDPNLVNPWGISFFPGGAFWINDNATGLNTLYDGAGSVIPVAFVIPAPPGQTTPSSPTGTVINTSTDFLVPGTSLHANFLFATEDGTISAWADNLPTNPQDAVLAVDNSQGGTGAVYKALALGSTAAGNFIYATNFRAGTIDVFDATFKPAGAKLLGTFTDSHIQNGYAPFGIANINGDLFVTYAKQNAAKHDDVPGPGHGYVDVFDTDGRLIQRFAQGGLLDSPWAVTLAPRGFGALGNEILIGNFGNGAINAYDLNGRFRAPLEDARGRPIVIDGLWALTFGGAVASTPDTLYFSAGPDHERHGLFGAIAPN